MDVGAGALPSAQARPTSPVAAYAKMTYFSMRFARLKK